MKKILKIVSWNINSIRRRELLIKDFLKTEQPDFLLLQEVKALEEEIPTFDNYKIYFNTEKGRNGVAILTPFTCNYVDEFSYDGRLVSVEYENIIISSLYMYNGFSKTSPKEKKIEMFRWMQETITQLKKPLIIGGDFNVVYKYQEVSNMLNPYERDEIEAFQDWESILINTTPREGIITWWDYRERSFAKNIGMGLDKFYTTSSFGYSKPKVLTKYRAAPGPSDHAPVEISFFI